MCCDGDRSTVEQGSKIVIGDGKPGDGIAQHRRNGSVVFRCADQPAGSAMQSRSQCVEICSRPRLLAAWGEQRQVEFGEIDQIRACVRSGCGFHKASGELEVFAIACGQNDEVALLLSGHFKGMAKGSF